MAKIVYIEDESDIRITIAEELRDAGHDVIEEANGQLGFETIKRESPDLVLCDITMPVLDGFGLLYKLRENDPGLAAIPFVFLSAMSDRRHLISGRTAGADAYLTKPVDFDLLLAEVDSRLQQVKRVQEKKNQDLVTLYKAMTSKTKEMQSEPSPSSHTRTTKGPACSTDPGTRSKPKAVRPVPLDQLAAQRIKI